MATTGTSPGSAVYSAYTKAISTLVFNYQFENSGSLGTDSSGNGNTATNSGVTQVVDATRSNVGYFDGTDQMNSPALITATAYTKMAWVNPAALGSNLNIIGGNGGHSFRIGSTGLLISGHTGPGYNQLALTTNAVTAGAWYHLAVTFEGGTMKGYVNGVLIKTSTGVSNVTEDTTIQIGAFSSGTRWNGYLDNVKVHKGALSDDEILAIYNAEVV